MKLTTCNPLNEAKRLLAEKKSHTNQVSFYRKVHDKNEGEIVDIIYLALSKTPDTLSLIILIILQKCGHNEGSRVDVG